MSQYWISEFEEAILNNDLEQFRYAVVQIGDVNDIQKLRFFPLHVASEEGHTEIARLLIEKGADVNKRNGYGYTALHWAACKGSTEVANLLLQHGAEINSRDLSNNTPLHCASLKGHVGVVSLLIRSGADLNARTVGNKIPWDLACENGHGSALAEAFGRRPPIPNRNVQDTSGDWELAWRLSQDLANVSISNQNFSISNHNASVSNRNYSISNRNYSIPNQQINNTSGDANSSQSETSTNLPKCTICCDNNADHAIVPCFHVFCLSCINRSRQTSPNCPTCRRPIQSSQKLYFQ